MREPAIAERMTQLGMVMEERGTADYAGFMKRDLDRYAGFLAGRGVTELAEVTAASVADFGAELRSGVPNSDGEGWLHPPLATSSVARTVVAVRSLHRFAAEEGLVSDDPARSVRPPRPPRRLPKAASSAASCACWSSPAISCLSRSCSLSM